MRVALLALALASGACAASDGSVRPPFTAEEIRDATHAGRTYTWRLSAEGRVFVRRLKFIEVSKDSATTEAVNLGPNGAAMSEPEVKTTTWPEFVKHAAWPKDGTVITEDRITVPAGAFDCLLYTITETRDGKPTVTRAWFAKDLPGAPVKMIVEVGGTLVTQLELLEHQAGY